MTLRIAINGFGRIGRMILRALFESGRKDLEVIAINDLASVETNAHLFKWDSTHGPFGGHIALEDGTFKINNCLIQVSAEPNPENLAWALHDIDIVLECSGRFTKREAASKHLNAGARRVLISAPAEGADLTVVYGVNHTQLKKDHTIVSNASCTTNCLAPIAYALHREVGIKHGFMTTIHAYTADQNLLDQSHTDLCRARAAALSMIPTSTGAARAVGLVLPELKGRLDGVAIRVPTPNVSLADFKFVSERPTTREDLNNAIKEASQRDLKGILEATDLPLVSSDFNHHPASSIFDLGQTRVMDQHFCRVMAWYDNEWGFSHRMLDVAAWMGTLI